MTTHQKRALITAFLILGIVLTRPDHASAQQSGPEDILRDAVGVVEVHGYDTRSKEVVVSGSGFFISIEGYFVTARHLIEDAVKQGALRESLTYSVKMPSTNPSFSQTAVLYWSDILSDEVVLSVRTEGLRFHILKSNIQPRGDIALGMTPIFTAGYPENYPLVMDSGIVGSFNGPNQISFPLWVTNMSFKAGQSGSPVILKDGTVVAIVTAIDKDATNIGLLTPIRSIPSQLWDGFHEILEKCPVTEPVTGKTK